MKKQFPHGIDITAPGGIAALMDFHRATFGNAVMEAGAAPTPPAPPAPVPTPPSAPEGDSGEKLGEGGIKALQTEREARAKAEKDLADAKAQLQQIEDAKLSDIEKAQKERDDVATRAQNLERDNWRLAALAEFPVSKENRDLVTGTDAASFLASAERVSKLEAASTGKSGRPSPVRESGDRSNSDSTSTGGSLAAGRAMFADKHKKKEG